MSADLATVVMSAVAAAAASADPKVNVQVLDFSAATALWCVDVPQDGMLHASFKTTF